MDETMLMQAAMDARKNAHCPYSGFAVGAALLAAKAFGVDSAQWETMRILPAVDPQIDPLVAEEKYIRWHQFLTWCKSKN